MQNSVWVYAGDICKHWSGLHMSPYGNTGWVYTWVHIQILVGFILESLQKHTSRLCLSLYTNVGWVYTRDLNKHASDLCLSQNVNIGWVTRIFEPSQECASDFYLS